MIIILNDITEIIIPPPPRDTYPSIHPAVGGIVIDSSSYTPRIHVLRSAQLIPNGPSARYTVHWNLSFCITPQRISDTRNAKKSFLYDVTHGTTETEHYHHYPHQPSDSVEYIRRDAPQPTT